MRIKVIKNIEKGIRMLRNELGVPFPDKVVEVNLNTFISRLIKAGDLIRVKEEQQKTIKNKKSKKKGE